MFVLVKIPKNGTFVKVVESRRHEGKSTDSSLLPASNDYLDARLVCPPLRGGTKPNKPVQLTFSLMSLAI